MGSSVFKHDGGHPVPPKLKGFRRLDRDKLSMVSRHDAANAANLALFQLQDIMNPEEQVLGVGVLFATMCLRCGLDPADLHAMSLRVLHAPTEGDTPTTNALEVLRDFIGARTMAQDVVIA